MDWNSESYSSSFVALLVYQYPTHFWISIKGGGYFTVILIVLFGLRRAGIIEYRVFCMVTREPRFCAKQDPPPFVQDFGRGGS